MPEQKKPPIEDQWRRIREEESGSVREKLERLLQRTAAAAASRPRRRTLRPSDEDAAWAGEADQPDTPADTAFLPDIFAGGAAAECPFPIDSYHGRIRVGAGLDLSGDTLALISRDDSFRGIDPSRVAYFDLETTGLSPGSSNYAFMVGLGYFEGEEFRVRQHFMREFSDEIDILDNVEAFAARFDAVVTFNGRAFDLPLFEGRNVLARRRTRLSLLPHLDLLYPARQIWRERLESCSLKSLEYDLLGVERHGDIPGAEIPNVYFRYLRTRNPYWISRVFHHNRLDIVSLMCLTVVCHDLVAGRTQAYLKDTRDALGLAFFYERREKYEESATLFTEAIEGGVDAERKVRAIRRASLMHRRAGKRDRAMALWREGAQEDGEAAIEFLQQMAIQLEHHEKRFADALAVVEDALIRIERLRDLGRDDSRLARYLTDFEKRRARLGKKEAAAGLIEEAPVE
ncbi:MAG: ribonuclease H-like domain-containing protein [Acidobacteriota bacterium]